MLSGTPVEVFWNELTRFMKLGSRVEKSNKSSGFCSVGAVGGGAG